MKTALVTGASRGIGKALVEELESKGYFVFAGMREISKSPFKSNAIIPVALDVQEDTSIEDAAKIVAEKGPLDIVINNAGASIAPGGKKEHLTVLSEVRREALLTMFDINSVGSLIVTKYFVPLMTNENSFIINISSDRASFENENTNANYGYRSSKVALNMFTQCLLFDLPKNISTFAVHPGWVKTDLNPYGVISPAESAQKILHILAMWKPALNGAYLDTDGSLFPR
jgi:NAD(P)-dependent dehydrogenase (short-subunit alcohol dehydrogenase family)